MSTLREKDLQCVLDLTRSELTKYYIGVPKVTLKLKDTQKGTTHFTKGYFTIPLWAVNEGEEFTTYYVVHEFCHFVARNEGSRGHDGIFKSVERRALKLWGMDIEYKKAYPRALYANGMKVYESK